MSNRAREFFEDVYIGMQKDRTGAIAFFIFLLVAYGLAYISGETSRAISNMYPDTTTGLNLIATTSAIGGVLIMAAMWLLHELGKLGEEVKEGEKNVENENTN